jgi:hypothetical protein
MELLKVGTHHKYPQRTLRSHTPGTMQSEDYITLFCLVETPSPHTQCTASRRVGPRGGREVRPHPRCTRTLSGASPHRLRRGGCLLGLDLSFAGFGPWILHVCGPSLVLLECAFLIAHFDVLSCIILQNFICPKTCGKCEIKTLILSFGIHFYAFCLNVGG